MNEAITPIPARGGSPRTLARAIGAFSLATILAGLFAQGYVSNRLVDWGDAAATASNILAHPNLYQWGMAVYLVEMACNVVTIALFYFLLEPAGRRLSLVAAFLGLTACTIKTLGRVFFAAPLFVLGGVFPFHALGARAQNELALLLLQVNDHAAGFAMVFFGLYTLLTGSLILRSRFLPRILGVLSLAAGLSWLAYVSPPFAARVFPFVAGLALLGSAVKIFWLLVFGVDERRWREQAAASMP